MSEIEKQPRDHTFDRKVYVEGLKTEFENLDIRGDSEARTRRLAEVSAELAKYGAKPPRAARETAVKT